MYIFRYEKCFGKCFENRDSSSFLLHPLHSEFSNCLWQEMTFYTFSWNLKDIYGIISLRSISKIFSTTNSSKLQQNSVVQYPMCQKQRAELCLSFDRIWNDVQANETPFEVKWEGQQNCLTSYFIQFLSVFETCGL